MRRALLCSVICVLWLGGWAAAAAAAFCPHVPEEHACCRLPFAAPSPHRGADAGHGMTQAEAPCHAEESAVVPELAGRAPASTPPCAHCAGGPASPPAPPGVNPAERESTRKTVAVLLQAYGGALPSAPQLKRPAPVRRVAPPGDPPPLHLLLSVFLI